MAVIYVSLYGMDTKVPKLTEELVTVPYPELVRRVVEMQFGADEYSRALNVVLSSLYTDDPRDYIADVLGQLFMNYLEFMEEYERYILVYEAADRYMSKVPVYACTRYPGQITCIRDLVIDRNSLTFVLQHIT